MLPSVEQADTMIVEEESSTYGEIQPRDAQKEALADVKLRLFDTNPNSEERHAIKPVVPDSCTVDLDLQVINMLEEMARKRQPRKEKLYDDYFSLKQKLGDARHM